MNETVSQDGYALLASGGGRKLERFGEFVLDRPAPQAIWPASEETRGLWRKASAHFKRKEDGSGQWTTGPEAPPDSWTVRWRGLAFEIRLTGFGNVGLFPEHESHWDWMGRLIEGRSSAQVLNLFAYTGGASLACARAGGQVTHVDAAKSVNGWAIRNARLTGAPKDAIRFIAEEAGKFVRREQRRGRRYDGILIDPPTFGRGPKGEVWKLERELYQLVTDVRSVLSDDPLFVLATSHSPGVTPRVLEALLEAFDGTVTTGEMILGEAPAVLPAGCYARWTPA